MNRVRIAFAAAVVGLSLVGAGAAIAQETGGAKAPTLTPILGGKKFTPPIKGQADVDFTKPVTKKDNKTNMVVTTIQVKNVSNAPIPRLTIDETWYDKGGSTIGGGKGVINGLLQPGEVQTVTIETPWKVGMLSNNYNFTHANGTVKPHLVKSFDEAGDKAADKGEKKEPAAKKAGAKKK